MNPRRGHENLLHLQAKCEIGRLFDDPAWSVFFEQRNADVLVMHHETCFVAAIELESSPKNVLTNIRRNFAQECHAVAVVSLTERYLAQITNKTLKAATEPKASRIRVFTYDDAGLQELFNWITGLAKTRLPNTGGAQ